MHNGFTDDATNAVDDILDLFEGLDFDPNDEPSDEALELIEAEAQR